MSCWCFIEVGFILKLSPINRCFFFFLHISWHFQLCNSYFIFTGKEGRNSTRRVFGPSTLLSVSRKWFRCEGGNEDTASWFKRGKTFVLKDSGDNDTKTQTRFQLKLAWISREIVGIYVRADSILLRKGDTIHSLNIKNWSVNANNQPVILFFSGLIFITLI